MSDGEVGQWETGIEKSRSCLLLEILTGVSAYFTMVHVAVNLESYACE